MMQTVLGAWHLLLAAFPAAAAGPAADPHQSAGRSVFLDPAFGGKESGPILEGKIAGKRVTLDLAKEAYRVLRSRGISVHLSRSRDVTVSADDRAVKARKTGGDLYVALWVSRDGRNCMQVSVPAFPSPAPGDSTDAYLMDLMWENLRKKSGDLAQIVSRNLKDRGVALCGEVSIQKDAALEKAMSLVYIRRKLVCGRRSCKSRHLTYLMRNAARNLSTHQSVPSGSILKSGG